MAEEVKVRWIFGEYTRQDLEQLEDVALGALLRERTHHMIEVPLSPTLLKDSGKAIPCGLALSESYFGQEWPMVDDHGECVA